MSGVFKKYPSWKWEHQVYYLRYVQPFWYVWHALHLVRPDQQYLVIESYGKEGCCALRYAEHLLPFDVLDCVYFDTNEQKCFTYVFFTLVVDATKWAWISCKPCLHELVALYTEVFWQLHNHSIILRQCQWVSVRWIQFFYNWLTQSRVISNWLQPLSKNQFSFHVWEATCIPVSLIAHLHLSWQMIQIQPFSQ